MGSGVSSGDASASRVRKTQFCCKEIRSRVRPSRYWPVHGMDKLHRKERRWYRWNCQDDISSVQADARINLTYDIAELTHEINVGLQSPPRVVHLHNKATKSRREINMMRVHYCPLSWDSVCSHLHHIQVRCKILVAGNRGDPIITITCQGAENRSGQVNRG